MRAKRRTPIAYAGLLVVTFVAIGGAAVFSLDRSRPAASEPAPAVELVAPISARAGAAVLALSLDATPAEPTTPPTPIPPAATTSAATETSSTTDAPATTATTAASTTTRPDRTPPKIVVTSPEDGAVVRTEIVTFEGETEPGARVFSGPYEADVDEEGHWKLRLVVTEGPNGAVFAARDRHGNEASVRIVVHYEPPATTTTTKPPSTTTTTAPPAETTTTTAPSEEEWSPQWPPSPGGRRDVEEWRGLVAQYWDEDKVDCALGLIYRESRGDPQAHNTRTGAYGLFQHLLKYWKGRARAAGFVDGDGLVAHPFNAEANIAASAWLAGYYEARGYDWWRPWGAPPSYGSCDAGG